MYDCELRESVEKIFFKLAKKNPKQLEIISHIPHILKKTTYIFKFVGNAE